MRVWESWRRIITLLSAFVPLALASAADSLPAGWKTQINPTDGAEMVFIPAGEFQMGCDSCSADERPAHSVKVDGFWIYRKEVTCEQFGKFVAATKYRSGRKADYYLQPERSKLPAFGTSWLDAEAYCRWAGMRLPTEAEWEKAARGPEGFLFSYGNAFDPQQANAFSQGLMEGGGYGPNGYGLFDMSGNVWEWCSDWYDPAYYQHASNDNPTGPQRGTERVLRGGSWSNLPECSRATFRYRYFANMRSPVYGFRCARNE